MALLTAAKRYDYLEMTEVRFDQIIRAVLNRDIVPERINSIQYDTELFVQALDAARYAIAFRIEDALTLSDASIRGGHRLLAPLTREKINKTLSYANSTKCGQVVELAIKESQESSHKWASELTSWNNLVESARAHFGDQWVLYHIANVSSAIKSKTETSKDFTELFDKTKPLCSRARYARLRAGTGTWWSKQLENANDVFEKMFFLLVLTTWSSGSTLAKLAKEIDILVMKLSADNWRQLYEATKDALWLTTITRDRSVKIEVNLLPKDLDPKTVLLLGIRADQTTKTQLFVKYLKGRSSSEKYVNEFCLHVIYNSLDVENPDWANALKVIKQSYVKGVTSERFAFQRFSRRHSNERLPDAIAKEIAKNAEQYPGFLVAAAELRCRIAVSSKIIRVGDIAARDGWFAM